MGFSGELLFPDPILGTIGQLKTFLYRSLKIPDAGAVCATNWPAFRRIGLCWEATGAPQGWPACGGGDGHEAAGGGVYLGEAGHAVVVGYFAGGDAVHSMGESCGSSVVRLPEEPVLTRWAAAGVAPLSMSGWSSFQSAESQPTRRRRLGWVTRRGLPGRLHWWYWRIGIGAVCGSGGRLRRRRRGGRGCRV